MNYSPTTPLTILLKEIWHQIQVINKQTGRNFLKDFRRMLNTNNKLLHLFNSIRILIRLLRICWTMINIVAFIHLVDEKHFSFCYEFLDLLYSFVYLWLLCYWEENYVRKICRLWDLKAQTFFLQNFVF